MRDIKLLEGTAVVTDNFVLMPLPEKPTKGQVYKAVFTAARR